MPATRSESASTIGHPGGPQSLDLRVVERQADADDAINERATGRGLERASERGDERDAVARGGGTRGDAFREMAEPGIGEDDRKSLGVRTPSIIVRRCFRVRATGCGW